MNPEAPQIQSTTLLSATASWNGIAYAAYPQGRPQLTTLRMVIPAHASLPWHTHRMPSTAHIVSGELTLEEKDTGRTQTFRAGQSFAESVANVHRGRAGDETVVVIVTYAGLVGQPLSDHASTEDTP